MKKIITIAVFLLSVIAVNAQNITITDDMNYAPDNNAVLDIKSNNKGLLMPRVALIDEETPIAGLKPQGLTVWNTSTTGTYSTPGYYVWNGTTWKSMVDSENYWILENECLSHGGIKLNSGIVVEQDIEKSAADLLTLKGIEDTLFNVGPNATRFGISDYTAGVSGGFAVGRYTAAKDVSKEYLRVENIGTTVGFEKIAGVGGGFAVGRYGAAKGTMDSLFRVNAVGTRIGFAPTTGSFEVGAYGPNNTFTKYFAVTGNGGISLRGGWVVVEQDIEKSSADLLTVKTLEDTLFNVGPNATRFGIPDYTAGVSGGFAVGRYGAAKDVSKEYLRVENIGTTVSFEKIAGVSGGFAVGKFGATKDEMDTMMTINDKETVFNIESGGDFIVNNLGYSETDKTQFLLSGGKTEINVGSKMTGFGVFVHGTTKSNLLQINMDNTFLGYTAGNNSMGSHNIYIKGGQSTRGSNNIIIGESTADGNSLNNIIIGNGTNAGETGSGCQGNIFIGNGINLSGSNQFAVGSGSDLLFEGDITGHDLVIYANTNIVGTTTISSVLNLIPFTSAPTAPIEGQLYHNGTSHHIYCFLNGVWKQLD